MPRLDTRTRLGYSTRILGLGYPDRSRQFDRFEMNSPKRLSYLSGGGGRTSGERPSGPHFTLFINNTVLLGLGGARESNASSEHFSEFDSLWNRPRKVTYGQNVVDWGSTKERNPCLYKEIHRGELVEHKGCWSRNCLPKMKTMARFVFC